MACALSLALALSLSGQKGIRLILKDGTDQLVRSYEVRGDRVRFYSLERGDWEEIPLSLVDLEATKKGEAAQKSVEKKRLEDARELDRERYERNNPTGPEIAPGVHLPVQEGVYAYDGSRVILLMQSSAEIVTDKKRAALKLAMPAPLLKARSLVILQGPRAAVRITLTEPVFYIHASEDLGAHMELIPVKSGREARLVEKIQAGIGVGKSGEARETLPIERTLVSPGLYKLKATQPLRPGEYALGELIQDKLNLDLWDFGIDSLSKGPQNRTSP